MPAESVLNQKFYLQSTKEVAKQLLGKKLVRIYNGKKISGLITETEAYLGIKDKACHTYQGRKTERVKSMYLEGGHAYIYLIYGMYNCFNVVTRGFKEPEAVLIRSIEPIEGIDLMKKFRSTDKLTNLTTGPGKLCQALKLDRSLDGHGLIYSKGKSTVYIDEHSCVKNAEIESTTRIGIDYAEECAAWPLRFYIKGNKFISKK